MTSGIAPDVTDDGILNGRLRLLQPKHGHRFGHDAILLAAAVPATPGQRVAEFGAGVGAASFALMARVPGIDATLFEIDPELCALAQQNIERNALGACARVIAQDVTAPLAAGTFDHVFMNPPFNDARLQPSPDQGRRRAHAADSSTLPQWIGRASEALRDGGTITLIWRADGLTDVLRALETGFGAATVLPIYPAPDRPAIRLIATAVKGARAPARIGPSLVLNDAGSRPTQQAESILRHGAALPAGD